MEGRSLFELIHSRYHYDWSFVRQVGYQAALACEHVHSKGILHRDLKSSNFLVRPVVSAAMNGSFCFLSLGRGGVAKPSTDRLTSVVCLCLCMCIWMVGVIVDQDVCGEAV